MYNLVSVSSIQHNHLSWGGWHNIVGLLWHLKHIDCLKYIPQCAPLLLPAFKQLSFPVTVDYFSNFHSKNVGPIQAHWSNTILITRLNLALFLYNKKVEIYKTKFKHGKKNKIQWKKFQKISNKNFYYIDFFHMFDLQVKFHMESNNFN